MNCRQKRNAKGISFYTMVKELGIDKQKYLEVERKKLMLPSDLSEKFMNILSRAREIKFNRMLRMKDINEWLESGQAKADIVNMGYTHKTLADKLGVHYTHIGHTVNDYKKYGVSEDFKEELYDFLHNPLNKNLIVEEEGKKEEKMFKFKKEKLMVEPETKQNNDISYDKDARIKELETLIAKQDKEIKYLKETINRIFKI